MALTESKMMPLGHKMPHFSLPDVISDSVIDTRKFAEAKPTLVMFICNHCPYVIHIRSELSSLCNEFVDRGFAVIAVNSNDVANYPDDSPEKMKEMAHDMAFKFPYCFDESQEVARTYDAACTPEFFLFDQGHGLVYRGRFDDARPSTDTKVTGQDLRSAFEAVLRGEQPSQKQLPSMGCNIKWKS